MSGHPVSHEQEQPSPRFVASMPSPRFIASTTRDYMPNRSSCSSFTEPSRFSVTRHAEPSHNSVTREPVPVRSSVIRAIRRSIGTQTLPALGGVAKTWRAFSTQTGAEEGTQYSTPLKGGMSSRGRELDTPAGQEEKQVLEGGRDLDTHVEQAKVEAGQKGKVEMEDQLYTIMEIGSGRRSRCWMGAEISTHKW